MEKDYKTTFCLIDNSLWIIIKKKIRLYYKIKRRVIYKIKDERQNFNFPEITKISIFFKFYVFLLLVLLCAYKKIIVFYTNVFQVYYF